jgi:SlyX protein
MLPAMAAHRNCMNCQMGDGAMNGTKTLDERIDTLESRLTFLDETVETLNQTITSQWQQIDDLTRQLAILTERLGETEARAAGDADDPPPHY